MSGEQSKEYAGWLKSAAKELIDGIGIESEHDQRIIKLIYGFVRSGFLESSAEKGEYNKKINEFLSAEPTHGF